MSTTRKLLLGVAAIWLLRIILLGLIVGFARQEHRLPDPERVQARQLGRARRVQHQPRGPVPDHRRAADGVHDGLDRRPHAGAAQPGADRGRGALLADARQHHAGQHGLQDGGQVVPVHRRAVPVHLVLQPDRLPAAADQLRGDVQRLRRPHPVLRAVRGDGEHLGPARPRAGDLLHLQLRGHPGAGPGRLRQEPDPGRGQRPDPVPRSSRWRSSPRSCGSSR